MKIKLTVEENSCVIQTLAWKRNVKHEKKMLARESYPNFISSFCEGNKYVMSLNFKF